MSKMKTSDKNPGTTFRQNTEIILLCLLFLSMSFTKAQSEKVTDYTSCLSCHEGIERISQNHDFKCIICHLMPDDRSEPVSQHQIIIRNPSSPQHVKTFCSPCHDDEIRKVENSLHSTMAGIINQTRYLWGAQQQSTPAIYGLSGPLRPLPEPDLTKYPKTPSLLVDDFLRRRCLRCHIHSSGIQAPGLYRSSGCAACHVFYSEDGKYRGGDQAIKHGKKGYPIRHEFRKKIPNSQCLHCHNGKTVGADYEGLFEHDYSRTYRSPIANGKNEAIVFGMDSHHLSKDVHRERGLWCIDCHDKADIMGDGECYSYQMEVPKTSCQDCHGGFEKISPDPSIPNIEKDVDRFILISEGSKEFHPLPLFSNDSSAHRIRAHGRVRCSACHAQWSFQDYGLSVIREDFTESYKWFGLTSQGDAYLEEIINSQLETEGKSSILTKDWISEEKRIGIWSIGWRFRRWEFMPLGVDHANAITLLRPRYQYLISYVDRLGNVPLDSVIPTRGDRSRNGWAFTPYIPHTTAPFGRACEACHFNQIASGMGIFKENTADTNLTKPSPPALSNMRLLTGNERMKLLKPSERWYRERSKNYMTPIK